MKNTKKGWIRELKEPDCFRNYILVFGMALVLFGLSVFSWLKKEDSFSESERRVLEKFPKISVTTVMNGKFMKDFESYSLDQFPFRDRFRGIKAWTSYNILRKKDNNDIYLVQDHLSKMEYPMQIKMLDYAATRISDIYNMYLKDQKSTCYFSIVPDKNYFLAKKNGYLSMNYEELFSYMKEQVDFARYIDICGFLSIDDYYRTDTHWRQEKITDVAEHLKEVMSGDEKDTFDSKSTLAGEEDKAEKENKNKKEESNKSEVINEQEEVGMEVKELELPFYGVYYGQAALKVKPDRLYYLESDILQKCKVISYDTGSAEETTIYNMKKAKGYDAYEFFLSGASAIQVIENPKAKQERELVVFRDSFGSSLIPLLVDSYSKITVIDIRYVQSKMLGNMVDFHGQDVLFIYSTMILNNSMSLK